MFLRDGIISGLYPKTMSIESIYGSDVLFRQYKWENFKTNTCNLRKAIDRDIERANRDDADFETDNQHHAVAFAPAAGNTEEHLPIWAGSDAAKKLKEDVDAGLHITMKSPKDLHQLRPEYQAWPLKVFRDHIEQEVRSRLTQSYWLHRDKKQSASEPWPQINSA